MRPKPGDLRGRATALLVAGALLAIAVVAPGAAAAPPTSHLVIDANTGETLDASQPDALRHPASLTKMMTLYIVFDLIEQRRLAYSTRIKVTEQASSQPPSSLDLDEGQTLTVRDGVLALITKSANDVATAFAENLAGSEEKFARIMTAKARTLGMSRTVFRNASGLPDPEQVTTARDMATLAMRLAHDFPEHFKLFATQTFEYGGRRYRNHNTLLRTFSGVDGIKTGYIRASGFNLVSSVRREKRHVIGVVLGGTTAADRNRTMRVLLAAGLQKARAMDKPLLKARSVLVARAPASAKPAIAPTPLAVPDAPSKTVPQGLRAPLPQASALGGPRTASVAPAAARSESPVPSKPASRDEFHVQVGAFATEQEARRRLAEVATRHAGLVRGRAPLTPVVKTQSIAVYRARFAGFDAVSAQATCQQLKQHKVDCFAARAE
jgi:D-alanyl-D-alanine carboxypeptidase